MPLLESEPLLLNRPAALAMRVATDVVAVSVLVFLARFAGRGLRAAADVVVDVAALRTVLAALAPAFAAGALIDLVALFAFPAATGFAAVFATVLAAVLGLAEEARFAALAWVVDLTLPSAAARWRWLSTIAHSASVSDEGLLPWALASFAAFSMSLIKLVQDVEKRLSD